MAATAISVMCAKTEAAISAAINTRARVGDSVSVIDAGNDTVILAFYKTS